MLTTVLNDAIPRYLQTNPAQRRTGKGRKGIRRIERHEKAEKAWSTPVEGAPGRRAVRGSVRPERRLRDGGLPGLHRLPMERGYRPAT